VVDMEFNDIPISIDLLLEGTNYPTQPYATHNALIWLEKQFDGDSRYSIFFCFTKDINFEVPQQPPKFDILPKGYSVKSKLHEYGGRSAIIEFLSVTSDSRYDYGIYFCNETDQRIYLILIACVLKDYQNSNFVGFELPMVNKDSYSIFCYESRNYSLYYTTPIPISNLASFDNEDRYACLLLSGDKKYIFAIREQHFSSDIHTVRNSIVAIPTNTTTTKEKDSTIIIDDQHDFYSFIALSPDNKYFSYICWDHPNMPWDSAQLICSEIAINENTITVENRYKYAIDDASFTQPSYQANGDLVCICDKSGWNNLYLIHHIDKSFSMESLYNVETDFAKPDWAVGKYSYCILPNGNIVATYSDKNQDYLVTIGNNTIVKDFSDSGYLDYNWLTSDGDILYCVASSSKDMPAVIALDTRTGLTSELSGKTYFPDLGGRISHARQLKYRLASGGEAYALIYKPKSEKFSEDGKLPPLLINIHGGPTGSVSMALDLGIQFWTSRGFVVADLDFRGSSGHGRKYRKELDWGVTDKEDAEQLALSLINAGIVDKDKIFIRGKSSGGFTALSALISSNLFAGAVSYYGVCDPLSLAQNTHKFESHYMENLIGPLPEYLEMYKQRSVLYSYSQIKRPVLLFHGYQDKIVPISQTINLVSNLITGASHVELFTFENEGHGFRNKTTLEFCYMAELQFYNWLISSS